MPLCLPSCVSQLPLPPETTTEPNVPAAEPVIIETVPTTTTTTPPTTTTAVSNIDNELEPMLPQVGF